MELKEFASLIANNQSYNIKVVLSALLEQSSSDPKWGLALANLYKDFPTELKESPAAKKELLPTILRYFSIYGITKDNEQIYYEFDSIIPAVEKDKIKSRNPNWNWEKEPEVVFKNPLELIKAIPKNTSKSPCVFIEKYKDQFENFLKTKKNKVLEHLHKKEIWQLMIKNDYIIFKDFCEKYNIDRIDILKQEISSNNRTSLAYFGGFKDKHVDSFLNDLEKIGKEELFSYPNMRFFNPQISLQRSSHENVLNCLFNIISQKQYDAAIKYMDFFSKELDNIAKMVSFNKSFKNASDFKELVNIYVSSCNISDKYEAQKVERETEWFNYLNSYNLMVKLNENLDENVVKSKKLKV